MTTAPRKVFLVSHTHWDREWYRTFHRFRVDLVRILREVLTKLEEEGPYRHYVLDGQVVALEDHLEIHPEDAERVRALVRRGALALGPWYVLPDEFLVSGEAVARNLVLGDRVCAAFGGAQKVGYIPDSFGHLAQMPQILREAGIFSFIYTRGNGDEIEDLGLEYRWEAPDGSRVLAIHQLGGYCNAGGLGHEEQWHAQTRRDVDPARAVEQVGEIFRRMAEYSNGDVYLLNNGCDHLPPQRRFGEILGALEAAFPDTEFHHSGLEEYLAEIRKAGIATRTYRGELLGGRLQFILSGVWSARMGLKQRNEEVQTLLTGYVEPIRAYCAALFGLPYPRRLVESAWKLLLKNHAHDSICGCSTDEVHRAMGPRFTGVMETGEQLIAEALERLAPGVSVRGSKDGDVALAVLNPLPLRRSEVVTRLVVLPEAFPADSLVLEDERGGEIEFEVVEERRVRRTWGVDYASVPTYEGQREKQRIHGAEAPAPGGAAGETERRVTLRFVARDLPGLGHVVYTLRRGEKGASSPAAVRIAGDVIENGLLRVRLHPDGRMDLTDLRSGETYPGLNRLEDTEDAGDEYDYAPARATETVLADGTRGRVREAEAGGLSGALEAACVLLLPAGLAADRDRRSGERVACPVRTRVRLTAESPVAEIETVFENRVEDHRLRVAFGTPFRTDRIVSDGQFLVISRSLSKPGGEDWLQPPPKTVPQQEFSLLTDGARGLTVLNRGLPEAAAHQDEEGRATLSLTLLRAVGWLSRDDFETRRRAGAGPMLATPEAQCPGEWRFRYGVAPFEGGWIDAGIKDLSARYRTPVAVRQGLAGESVPGGRGLLEKTSPATSVTAVKWHEERESLVVRLVNLSDAGTTETLRLGQPVAGAFRVGLLEDRRTPLAGAGEARVAVPLGAHEIATVEIVLAPRETVGGT